ncbi:MULTISPECIES: excalibur calcium-binding domain-containing protein [Aeromonas]|uniref:excalibur calcium-binding domain-containing protein n=1 Tax=Aeromonas TaxID=642 RepID=UPI002B054803|nr:excalibur calcium-binding domain-containing protein [Aeromonas jandaei]
MRYQGRIVHWNEERGFGFIVPEQEGTQKGAELFVHITALQTDGLSPMAGERVSYLMGSGKDGKPRAEQVFFPDRPLSLAAGHSSSRAEPSSSQRSNAGRPYTPASTYRRPRPAYQRRSRWRSTFVPLLLVALCLFSYSRFSAESVTPAPVIPVSSDESRIGTTDDTNASLPTRSYQCDGRQYCSQMTSCEEATWFLQNCPNTKMDGEGDGIPCENQWCGN